jgi:outer membrane protein TolC
MRVRPLKSIIARLVLLLAATLAHGQDATNQVKSLTLRECIERALANNLDIKIQRINPSISSWGVVAAQSVYDPALAAQANYVDSSEPLTTLQDGPASRKRELDAQLGLTGKLPAGTRYNLSSSDTRFYAGTLRSNFTYSGTSAISLTQPLLKNLGFGVNSAQIRVARKARDIAVQNFALQVITSIRDTSIAYYELVFAIENHKAKLENLTLARELLDQTQKRLQIGVASPLDVTQAQAGVAEREQAAILAERTIRDNQNALVRLISQNVAEFQSLSLLPVDYPVVEMVDTDMAQSIRTALDLRPDYIAARHAVEQQNILVKFNRNQLWPEVDLQGSYGVNSAGDTFNSFSDNTAAGNYPVWTVGVTLTVPLGNRQARANYNTARLQTEQLLLQLKRLEQQIIVDVDNAVGHVRTNLKSVEAARAATRLARESLDAEKKKQQVGASTTLLVLQAQSLWFDALSAQIRAEADYSESLIDLARAEGTTLQKNNIVLDEKF